MLGESAPFRRVHQGPAARLLFLALPPVLRIVLVLPDPTRPYQYQSAFQTSSELPRLAGSTTAGVGCASCCAEKAGRQLQETSSRLPAGTGRSEQDSTSLLSCTWPTMARWPCNAVRPGYRPSRYTHSHPRVLLASRPSSPGRRPIWAKQRIVRPVSPCGLAAQSRWWPEEKRSDDLPRISQRFVTVLLSQPVVLGGRIL